MSKRDILEESITNGVTPYAMVGNVGYGEDVELKDRAEYSKLSNVNNPANPNAPTEEELDSKYAQAKDVKTLNEQGYYRPHFASPQMATMAGVFSDAQIRPFMQRAQLSQLPMMKNELAPGGYEYVMNQDRDAYENSWYAKPDGNGGYEKIQKTQGWEAQPGKFVFEPNPDTGGATKMAVLLDIGDEAVGRDVLSAFGPPQEYTRNYFTALLGNMASALPRLGENIGQLQKSVNNAAWTAGGGQFDVFENKADFDDYVADLSSNISDAKTATILNNAIASGDRKKMLDAFNFVEQKLPADKRSDLYKKRMPNDYNIANARFNGVMDMFEQMQVPKYDELSGGTLDSWRNFAYTSAGVLADLIPQIASSIGGAQLGAKIGLKVFAKKGIKEAMEKGAKVGSMFAGGFVGGAQAIGATMEALADAGFDARQQSRILPLIMTAMPLTEGLVSGGWMGRYLPQNIVANYKAIMVEEAAKVMATSGGKITAKEAMELTKASVFNFWNNPGFKRFVQTSFLGKELPISMLAETGQEISEDWIYNIGSLIENKMRPDYYGDSIDSGVNDFWGEDGVINGAQMVETALITAFTTGIADSARAGMTGRLKKGAGISQQRIAAEAWAANQATKGNLGVFKNMAEEESYKERNIFGAKTVKLSDIGAENITIPADVAARYEGRNLGVKDAQGNIIIDNQADMNYFDFLQRVDMMEEIAGKNGLDGKTPNSRMLNELLDINGILLSSKAMARGVELEEATKELNAFKADAANAEDFTKLKELEDNVAIAKERLSYYTQIEEGTQFSKRVNDTVKDMIATQGIAEEKTKKQFELENLNLNNRKQFEVMKNHWNAAIEASQSYETMQKLLKNVDNVRLSMQAENEAKAERIRLLSSNEVGDEATKQFTDLDKHVDTLVESLATTNKIEGDKEFVSGIKELSNAINDITGAIKVNHKINYMQPEVVDGMQKKYSELYDQALGRLNGISNGNADAALAEFDNIGIDDSDSMNLQGMAQGGIDYTQQVSYTRQDEATRAKIDDIMSRASLPIQAKSVGLNEDYRINESREQYDKRVQDELAELAKPVTNEEAYEAALADITNMFVSARESVDPEMEGSTGNNPFYGLSSNEVKEILEGKIGMRGRRLEDGSYERHQPVNFIKLLDHFDNSYEVANRLNGKQQFNDHSSQGEQLMVGKLANNDTREDIKGRVLQAREDYSKFIQMSGISDIESTTYQHHKKAVLLHSRIQSMNYVVGLVNDGTEVIPKNIVDAMNSFVLTPEIEALKGEYSENTLALMFRAEEAVCNAIDIIKTRKLMDNEKVMEQLLAPFSRYVDWSNTSKNESAKTITSAVGFDGYYLKGKENIYDVDRMRTDAGIVDLAHYQDTPYTFRTMDMMVVERLQQYAGLLTMMRSQAMMADIMAERLRLTDAKKEVSTYEQELCEDTVIGFLTGGRDVLRKIHSMSKKFESKFKVINDMLIIPGDYGTGKTQHVLRRSLDIVKALGLQGEKTSLAMYAPSQNLVDTHRLVFDNGDGKSSFHMFNELKDHKDVGKGNRGIVVIDEGSLLNEDKIEAIRTLQQQSSGDVSIIVLADLNQMKNTEDMDSSAFRYPKIMLYGFKATTLYEQFSTLSPIIRKHAAYWKALASSKSVNITVGEMPMGYAVRTADGNYGVQYSSTKADVVTSFLANGTKEKALIFENQEEYNTFMTSTDEETRNALKTQDSKVFFIHYDETVPHRVIQGLREQEVYIVPDYHAMKYHPNKAFNDYVAIYTAFGRAKRYVNINIGARAAEFMTTDASKAASVGDTNSDTDHIARKTENMLSDNQKRFKAMNVKKTAPAKQDLEEEEDEEGEEPENKLITIPFDGEKKVFSYEMSTKGGKTIYDIIMIEATSTVKIGKISSNDVMDSATLTNAIRDMYAKSMEKQAAPKKGKGKEPVSASRGTINKREVSVGDITPDGEIASLKVNDRGIIVETEILTPDGTPVGAELKKIKTIIPEGLLNQAFASQGFEWQANNAVYSTAHFINAPGATKPTKEQMEERRAVQSHIMEKAEEYGLTLNLVFSDKTNVYTPNGFKDIENILMVVLDTKDKEALKNFADSYKRLEPGHVRSALWELSKSRDISKDFEAYRYVSAVARPLMSPDGKIGKTVVRGKRMEKMGTLENDLQAIRKGYAAQLEDPMISRQNFGMLTMQMNAQIGIRRIYEYAKNNRDKDGTVKNGAVSPGENQVKVEYDNSQPLRVQEFTMADGKHYDPKAFSFGDNSLLGTQYDENGQLVAAFTINGDEQSVGYITINAPFLDDKRINTQKRNRAADLNNEDSKAIAKLVTTTEVYDGKKNAIVKKYRDFESAARQMHIYKLLMANRSNILKKHEGSKRTDLSQEYQKYFTYSKDGRSINFAGDNLSEQKETIRQLMELVYSGDWKNALYDYVRRVENADGSSRMVIDENQFMYTNASRINTPHNFVNMDNILEAMSKEKVQPSALSGTESAILENQKRVGETTPTSRIIDGVEYARVTSMLPNTFKGNTEQYKDARIAGNRVDTIVRDYFNNGSRFRPAGISEEAFTNLIEQLDIIKQEIERRGERFMANNIVVFDEENKVAGEVDILSVNSEGLYSIYDIKTSKDFSKSAYDAKHDGLSKRMSHRNQLSAYSYLLSKQYGIKVDKLGVLPFEISYDHWGNIATLEKKPGIAITYNKEVEKMLKKQAATDAQEVTEEPVTPPTKTTSGPKKRLMQTVDDDTANDVRISRDAAREIVTKLLGESFVKGNLHFISDFIRENGKVATGMVENGHMTVSDKDGVRMSTPYHETMHIVWNDVLSPKARDKYTPIAQRLAMEETGNWLNGVNLEEWMARDMTKKSMSKNADRTSWEKFKAFLKHLVDFFHKDRRQMDRLYNDILRGKMRDATITGGTYKLFEETNEYVSEYINDDAIDRYIDLKNTVDELFPGNRNLLEDMVRRTQFEVVQHSSLSNVYAFSNVDLLTTIQGLQKTSEDFSKECGGEYVVVERNGKKNRVLVSWLEKGDYKNIRYDDDSMTEQEARDYAQALYRTWFFNRQDNYTTIMEHILPEYDSANGSISRGKLYDGLYDRSDLDPYKDGYTAELKLQLSTIPVVTILDGKKRIDSKKAVFVDSNLMKEILKRAGVDAFLIMKKSNNELSHTDALQTALENLCADNGMEIDSNGRYASPITEAAMSFMTRFYGNLHSTFYDDGDINEDGKPREYYPLLSIVGNVLSEQENYRAQGLPVPTTADQISKTKRVNKIMSFISVLSSTGVSAVVTRNMKMTLRGNEKAGFKYSSTEYSNNPFDDHMNKMKNNLEAKFNNGILTNERTIEQLTKYIQVSTDGSITVGKDERGLITATKTDKGIDYSLSLDEGRDTLTDNNIDEFLTRLNLIRGIIGLTTDIMPDNVVREFLRSKKFTGEVKKYALKMEKAGLGNIITKYGNNPSKFIIELLANTIYTFKAQTEEINLQFKYQKNGKDTNYNATVSLTKHVKDISTIVYDEKNDLFQTDNDWMYDSSTDSDIQGFSEREDVLQGAMAGKTMPFSDHINAFTKKIGATLSEDEDVVSDRFVNPSQFYTALGVVAAQTVAMNGNLAGHQLYRPDGKKLHTLQGRNMINTFIDGSGAEVEEINNRLKLEPDLLTKSVMHDSKGNPIAPYLITGKGSMRLDHMGDFFGMENKNDTFTYGHKNLTPHDFIAMSVYSFLTKVRRSTTSTQMIVTPMMTISDTGKIYTMFHKFNTEGFSGNIVRVYGDKNEKIMLDYDQVHHHLALQAQKINRRVQLSRQAFIDELSAINKALKIKLPLPSTRTMDNGKSLSMEDYAISNADMISKAMNKLPQETRSKVMEMVRGSSLIKGADVVMDEDNNTFSMGAIATDNISGLTKDGNIYTLANRRKLLDKRRTASSEKLVKELFHEDFSNMVDYLAGLGFSADKSVAHGIVKAGTFNGFNSKKSFLDQSSEPDVMKVNEALFAFHMMMHLTNNAFDDINGGIMTYKNITDQVKRMGPMNTPKNLMNTNVLVNGHHIGSLPKISKSITIYDLKEDVRITDKLSATIDEATNGQSFILPLYTRLFDISSGGKEYSIGGAGSMMKTLLIMRDPIRGTVKELKHAAKHITETDFNNSIGYRNMVMDGFKAQDQILNDNVAFQEMIKGTSYENFSWENRFKDYFEQTGSMDKAIDMLFSDMVNSQYVKNGGLYEHIVNSVMYGFNPLSTRKTAVGSINDYDSRPQSRKVPSKFYFEDIDNTQLGLILNSEQPINDSKPQSPFQQQEAFFGIGDMELKGEMSDKYGKNAGKAVSVIRKQIYDESMKTIIREIDSTKPEGVDRGINQPKFSQLNWMNPESITTDTRDLAYAMSQFEWYLRNQAKRGMANAEVQANYTDMLATSSISRELPQMRNKMVQAFRKQIDRKAIKVGMTGIRTVQATGVLHEIFVLKDGADKMPFTRQEALEHMGLVDNSIAGMEVNDGKLMEMFTRRSLQDMDVDTKGTTRHGEIVMPYIYAQKLGIRIKGIDGATKSESVRDVFTLVIDGKKVNVRGMDRDAIAKSFGIVTLDDAFLDSFLVRKALENMGINKYNFQVDDLDVIELIKQIADINASMEKSLTVYANRVPSNRLGSGSILDIVGFHYDGNEAYIPIGMTLLNDSDFDIDQLAIYIHKMGSNGMLSNDKVDQLQSDILDIAEQVYMAKENQDNIFLESSFKDIKDVANEENTGEAPLNANTAMAVFKTYNDNKGGADAIGIMANTLSASAWLQTVAKDLNIPKDNPMWNIVNADRVDMKGKSSLVILVGDWLQAALDNAKANVLGKYGITKEAVPIAAIMIANGPLMVDGKRQTTKEFFRFIKDFFNNYSVRQSFGDAALGSSLHYSAGNHNLYLNVNKHLKNTISAIAKYENTDVDTELSANMVREFESEKLLPFINEYLHTTLGSSITVTFDGTQPSISEGEFSKLVHEFVDSTNEKSTKAEQEIVAEYKKLDRGNKDAQRLQGLMKANDYLGQLHGYIIQAEALRSMSNILSLRNGIPAVDSDIRNVINNIELSFGENIIDVASGKVVSDDEFIQYFMDHSNNITEDNMAALIDKAMQVREMMDLNAVRKAIPMLDVYINQLAMDSMMMEKTFMIDSNAVDEIRGKIQQTMGWKGWKYDSQEQTFINALMEVGLDKHFTDHVTKPVNIETPVSSGNGFALMGSAFSDLDMRNIFDRETLSLEMPNFVMNFKQRFTSSTDMEEFFQTISDDYAGVSDAFYDLDGNYTGNYFINSLVRTGKSERKYISLAIPSNQMSETKRRMLMNDFDKFPQAIKDLFIMNEWINNKLSYRAGSIIDIIGIDPFRGGLSNSFNQMTNQMRKGQSFNGNQELFQRFNDYMALQDGITKFVKMTDLGIHPDIDSEVKTDMPDYVHTKIKVRDMDTKRTFKKNDDGEYDMLFLATGRSGLSMNVNPVTKMPTLGLNADDTNNLYLAAQEKDGSIVKTYSKGHTFTRGTYLASNGMHVDISPRGIDIIVKPAVKKPDTGVTVRAKVKNMDREMAPIESEDYTSYYGKRFEARVEEVKKDDTLNKCQ